MEKLINNAGHVIENENILSILFPVNILVEA